LSSGKDAAELSVKAADFEYSYYTFVVYSASAIFVPAFTWVEFRYGVSTTVVSLGLAIYVFGYGLGPLLFSPISEIYYVGRNPPYLVSFICFIAISVVTAVVADKSFAGLIICRFLQGYFGSPILASGGASVEDLYDWFSVPYAFIFWIGSMYCGPAIGPLLAAYTVPVDWRWPLWQITIISSPLFFMLALLPETSPAQILYRRAARLRLRTGDDQYKTAAEVKGMNAFLVIKDAIIKPFEIGSKDPAIRFVSLYGSLIYAIYYSFFEAFPLTYVGIYEMGLAQVCMIFLCVVIGCAIFGTAYFVYLRAWFIPQCRRRTMSQESRLLAALPTAFLAPIGLFLYGWTARASIHWAVPTSGVVIYAGTSFVLFQCIICYVALSYPKYVASLLACNFFFRSIWAAGFIMFSHPMYSDLGIGKGVSILGSLSILGIVGVWYLYYYGRQMRAKSTFAAS
jgi:MFS transporter, DHA1 family, multidrug resistance protein